MNYPLYVHFIFSLIGTLGFCILFHVPPRHMAPASIGGALGWITFVYMSSNGSSGIAACFLGACVVSTLAEFFSRAGKEATTLFIIPGIIPLVPGAPLYYTMRSLLDNDFESAARLGTEALFMAGSIAMALLLVASVTRILMVIIEGFQVKQ
ncbi:MAG: threonine/serine exporter family protein [Peptostreptococcaceae bacterium]|nr:threonine/serine exporter family protein [Peptostreptococcaceae bacterium]